MQDAQLAAVRQWLQDHRAELLADTQAMLRIPSIEGDPGPNAPYGKANRAALDLALQLAERAGMTTRDLEGHIGYGEFGTGEAIIMSLGHLDVVPTGPGWKHDPFGAEIDGDYLYARGATDDKGPTMASFYAMRAILASCPDLGVRFRQVFGCNEESGFRCVERYVQTEEAPTFGVAPDSGWPCYHAEKGIANLEIDVPVGTRSMQIVEISGGDRPNIVIDRCAAKVRVADSVRAEIESKLEDAWDRNVTFAWEGDVLGVFAIGKAAHGSTPFRGDSAATRVLRFLAEIAPVADEEFYGELLEMTHPGGAGLGISGSDAPSRDLTANLGVISSDGENVHLLVNVRYPVTWTGTELSARCQAFLDTTITGGKLVVTRDSAPLYFPVEHPLVRTIVDVYAAETGERLAPGTMGGGTYARAIPNTVSIGTGWAGDGKAHETDERVKVDHLYRMAEIYAHLFLRLAREAQSASAVA
ncbi:MAG: Sapep family Mn(2+)-dependent dipeptidase [Fimbriimonadaceae bacterium]|nr:Sapep family Mn(2+)-dependent dipeptidase [Fimbriimonadaceae bacterium]